MNNETKAVDVLAVPGADPIARVRAAEAVLFQAFTALIPEGDRNFGPLMHARVLRAIAGGNPAAMDAVERFLIVRDAATVPAFRGLRADIIRNAMEGE